ncbi:hypothetical protein O6H91_05G104600 [Diphasiastrum complanatum]|uniref:Uncharacterized protein n=1 Tax=Diphasiastrum complanatum TaxID=34168 RepID=A0ACC2DRL4_DIPCM|nr:hypothetical protein O6H91_05G104600 [Diphasiastrum complanatum]
MLNGNGRQLCCPPQCETQLNKDSFYTIYKSCVFAAGYGFAGVAFQKGQYLWLNGRQALESRESQQTQFLKDANIETLLCIPCQDGVLELGTVKQIQEDFYLVQSICLFLSKKGITIDDDVYASWLVEHLPESFAAENHPIQNELTTIPKIDEKPKRLGYSTLMSHDLRGTNIIPIWQPQGNSFESLLQEQELDTSIENHTLNIYQLEGPPSSLNPEHHLLATKSDNVIKPIFTSSNEKSPQADSNIFTKCQELRIPNQILAHWNVETTTRNQWMLKKCVHGISREVEVDKARVDPLQTSSSSHGGSTKRSSSLSIEEVPNNHTIAERKRRKNQGQQFSTLRSLIPFASKGDKLSILQNAIVYMKQVKDKVGVLEQENRELQSTITNNNLPRLPQARADAKAKEVMSSPISSVEEVFRAFKEDIASSSLTASGTGGNDMDQIIKVDHIHERSISIEVCCQKKTPDLLIHIFSCVLHMGFEVISSVQSSTLDELYISMTAYDLVGKRDYQRLCVEIEEDIKRLLYRIVLSKSRCVTK